MRSCRCARPTWGSPKSIRASRSLGCGQAVFPAILHEFRRTEASILKLTGQADLLDNEPWLRRSIQLRNPYIDPMNYLQVALLRRWREAQGAEADALREAVLLSVNGVAAGLRNTG